MEIKDLTPNPDNPRTISDEKLKMLKRTLTEYGDLGGFVFNRKTKQLVGGHQRAKLFEKKSKIVIDKKYIKTTKTGTVAEGYVELLGERFKYREVFWDETREKAANIAANKGAGEWDLPKLSEWLKSIDDFGFDLDLTMFDELERASLLNVTQVTPDEAKDNALPKIPKVAKTKVGDLYILGKHRLLCGDATKLEDFETLMGNERADICFTSPPYNGNTHQMRNGKAEKLYENYSDDLPSDEYVRFAQTVLSNCIVHSSQYVFWNVNYNTNSRSEFLKQILPQIDLLDELVCWKKTALPVPHGLTRTWEPIFVFKCHNDKKRLGHVNVTEFNHWEINNAGALDDSHRAAFPVALPSKAIELVNDACSILDPFGGSGTTMIAAEKYQKACFMMELDPIYCDVIVSRWEMFTGQKAELTKPTAIPKKSLVQKAKEIMKPATQARGRAKKNGS